MNIFVSVGSTANPAHEAFVQAIEARLRLEGLEPKTVGRNHFSADSPFIGVNKLMDTCAGVVVIATERLFIEAGIEKRGGAAEKPVVGVKLATPWNQIEAALAYGRKLPILVIVEEGVRQDGLLEKGFDWYVFTAPADPAALHQPEFVGVLADWKQKVQQPAVAKPKTKIDAAEMTVLELIGSLKPVSFWTAMGAVGGVFITACGAAFALGAKLAPFFN
jgi:hypothetical protein